jgi:hypothetical protein
VSIRQPKLLKVRSLKTRFLEAAQAKLISGGLLLPAVQRIRETPSRLMR